MQVGEESQADAMSTESHMGLHLMSLRSRHHFNPDFLLESSPSSNFQTTLIPQASIMSIMVETPLCYLSIIA